MKLPETGHTETSRMMHTERVPRMNRVMGYKFESAAAVSVEANLSPCLDCTDYGRNMSFTDISFYGVETVRCTLVLNGKPEFGVTLRSTK